MQLNDKNIFVSDSTGLIRISFIRCLTENTALSSMIFLSAFSVYLLTVGPSFNFLDSPEFIAFSYNLDIPHPPGHPLYPLLGKLSTFVPFGSIALKVNLLSAIFASLTALIIYHLIHIFLEISIKENTPTNAYIIKTSSVVSTLSIIFTYSFWIQAVRAEVYSLNSFFISLLILILIRFVCIEQFRPKYFFIFSFVLGLAYCNHTLAITLLLPAFFFLVICIKRKIFKDIKLLSLALFFFFFGLSIYLYLPVRSSTHLYIDWGNPENAQNFINVISGYQYHRKFPFPTQAQLLNNLKNHFSLFSDQLTYSFILFAVIGIIFLIKKDFFLSIFTLILFVIGLAGTVLQPEFINVNPDAHAYLFTSFLMIALWLSYGIHTLLIVLYRLLNRLSLTRSLNYRSVFVTCSFLFLLIPITIISLSYAYADRSNSYFPNVFTMKILDTLKPYSVILSRGDEIIFPIWYYQICENRYQDLIVIEQSNFATIKESERVLRKYKNELKFPNRKTISHWIQTLPNEAYNEEGRRKSYPPWAIELIKNTVFLNLNRRNIYYQAGEVHLFSKNNLLPHGIIYKVQKNRSSKLSSEDLKHIEEFWNWMNKQFNKYPYLSYDASLKKFYSNEYYNMGNYFLNFNLFDEATTFYKNSIKLEPEMVLAHLNLGSCYLMFGLTNDAIREAKIGTDLAPNNATTFNHLGFIYLHIGDFKNAEINLLKALELNPKHKKAQGNLKKLKSILEENNAA